MPTEKEKLRKLLKRISSDQNRKLYLNVSPFLKDTSEAEGRYSLSSDTIIVKPNQGIQRLNPKHAQAILMHEMDHVFHLRTSLAGLVAKEYDLNAKRMYMLFLLLPTAEDSDYILNCARAYENLRDGLMYDVYSVIEGSAIMITLEIESAGKSTDSSYDDYELTLELEDDERLQSYHLCNEIRKKFGRAFVQDAIQIALNNGVYPFKSYMEIFQRIVGLLRLENATQETENESEKLIQHVLNELHLELHPYRDAPKRIVERSRILQEEEYKNFKGLVSWYYVEGLRLWRRPPFSLKTLEDSGILRFNETVDNDKKHYVMDIPTYIITHAATLENLPLVSVNPLFNCALYAFFSKLDALLGTLMEKYRLDPEAMRSNVAEFRTPLINFLKAEKQHLEERFPAPCAEAILRLFPQHF